METTRCYTSDSDPETMDEIKGTADGTGVSSEDTLILNDEEKVSIQKAREEYGVIIKKID